MSQKFEPIWISSTTLEFFNYWTIITIIVGIVGIVGIVVGIVGIVVGIVGIVVIGIVIITIVGFWGWGMASTGVIKAGTISKGEEFFLELAIGE